MENLGRYWYNSTNSIYKSLVWIRDSKTPFFLQETSSVPTALFSMSVRTEKKRMDPSDLFAETYLEDMIALSTTTRYFDAL